jgi:uncharacterized protein YkwD
VNSGRLISLSAVMLLALAPGCTKGSGSSVPFGRGLPHVAASPAIAKQEREMFLRLNQDRKERGLPALAYDSKLADVGRFHSADMRDHRFFDHHSPTSGSLDDRLNAAGYLFLNARENLSEAPDVERSQDGLLDSPPHYANIMSNDVTHVGIGIVEGGVVDATNLTVTQVFARPAEHEMPEHAARRALDRLDRERTARQRSPAKRSRQLMQLAEKHLEDLDERASPESVERAGQGVVKALEGKEAGSVMISAQVVPSSDQVGFPDALLEASKCDVGLAVRRAKGEHGRPALQVLLLARPTP